MCDGYADGPAVWRSDVVTARKPHTCCACQETIPKGVKYRNSAGCYDFGWESFKHCDRCWAMLNAIEAKGQELGDYFKAELQLDCGESWVDNFGPPPPELVEVLFSKPGEVGF